MLHDAGKLLIICLILVGGFVLILTGHAEFESIDNVLSIVLGYVVGNGATALRSKAPSPMITSRVANGQVVTVDGPKVLVDPNDFPGDDAAAALEDLKREGGDQWPAR